MHYFDDEPMVESTPTEETPAEETPEMPAEVNTEEGDEASAEV